MISPDLTKAEYETLAEFRHALRQFLKFSEEAAQGEGLSPQAYQAMLAIKGYPGRDWATVGELAEKMQIRPHSAVGLVDRLAAKKWVVRKVAKEDRRQVRVHLTPRGAAVVRKLAGVHRHELGRVGPHLRALLARVPASAPVGIDSQSLAKASAGPKNS